MELQATLNKPRNYKGIFKRIKKFLTFLKTSNVWKTNLSLIENIEELGHNNEPPRCNEIKNYNLNYINTTYLHITIYMQYNAKNKTPCIYIPETPRLFEKPTIIILESIL